MRSSQDASALANGTEYGLVAAYPLDEGQGVTAYDQTPNHNDGTLAAIGGDLPTWVTEAVKPSTLGATASPITAPVRVPVPTTFRISL